MSINYDWYQNPQKTEEGEEVKLIPIFTTMAPPLPPNCVVTFKNHPRLPRAM